MTSSIAAALLLGIERWRGGNVPSWAFWSLAPFGLLWACYLAWRDERQARPGGIDVTGLVRLRDSGVLLRNRDVRNDEELAVFHGEFETWQGAVIAEMQRVQAPVTDIAVFRTLDRVPVATFRHTYNDHHAKDLGELTEQLRRLVEIAQRNDTSRRAP